jgi:tetratricopeptide (TPR) repeat protein
MRNRFSNLALVSFLLSLAITSANAGNSPGRHTSVKDLQNKIDNASKAIEKNPNDSEAYKDRFFSLELLDQPAAALRDFKQLERLKFANPIVYFTAASLYVAQGDDKAALTALDKCLKIKADPQAYRQKGQILWKQHQTTEALLNFNQAIKYGPRDYWNYEDRANCLIQIGQFKEALQDANSLIRLRPGEARNYIIRSRIYVGLGDKGAAASDQKRADDMVLPTL